jgi:hypothetical protein
MMATGNVLKWKLSDSALPFVAMWGTIVHSEKGSTQEAPDTSSDESIDELGAMPHYHAQSRV